MKYKPERKISNGVNKKAVLSAVILGLLGVAGFCFAQVVLPNPLDPIQDFKTLLLKIAEAIGVLISALGTIMIIVAAILYLTSAGSPEKINKAKTALIYAIIGIAVGISATVIVEVILGILGKKPGP